MSPKNKGRKKSTVSEDNQDNEEQIVDQQHIQASTQNNQSQKITSMEVQEIIQGNKQNEQDFHDKANDIQNSQNQPTTVTNRYTMYRQSFNTNWDMTNFDIHKSIQQFRTLNANIQGLNSSDEDQKNQKQPSIKESSKKNIYLKVYESNKQASGILKKTIYFLKCYDKTGQFLISRQYNDFVVLREKLSLRWPGCFIPPVPTKTFGNNAYELMIIRMKFLNKFLKKISQIAQIYYEEECQLFFKHNTQQECNPSNKMIENELSKLKAHSNEQLLQKYKNSFSNSIEQLSEDQQHIAIQEIKQLQSELKSWKIDLTKFKDKIRNLVHAKQKYYIAMTKLSTFLLPQYEEVVLGWLNIDQKTQPQDKAVSQNNSQVNQSQGNQSKIKVQKPNTQTSYLLNTQQYKFALTDTARSIQNYSHSLWLLYDIFKFQLKQTDCILEAIQSYDYLMRQKEYLSRNIDLNKEHVESLDNKKTSMKIFLMSGSITQKKQRLMKESQSFQNKLQVVKKLLNFVLNVLINSIEQFHNDRAQIYRRILAKSSQEQIVIVKKLMDFHTFELSLFERNHLATK